MSRLLDEQTVVETMSKWLGYRTDAEQYPLRELLSRLPSAQPEMDCMLKEYGDCTYSETGCSDCALKANIKKALKAAQLEPYKEEGEQ